ncbi:hypothetical protein JCM5350_007345 [Sporobolomyces pararoseus]
MNSPPLSNDGTDSDYGAELDFTDEALLAQLDRVQVESSAVIKQTPSSDEAATDNQETIADGTTELEQLTGLSREKLAEVLSEIEIVKIEEENRSLWERYRKRRGWGALSVSDFASPTWCEVQHTYRLASKSWLPPLERPATITTSKGLELVVDTKKTVKREKVLVKGTQVHSKIEKQVMGDIQQVKVETEGKESWWALRILNTIVSLSILIERGRVREVPVVGFVKDHLVFGVIDEIERREIVIPPPAPLSRPSTSSQAQPSSSTSSLTKSNQPHTPKKKANSKSKSTPSPVKQETKNDQSTLLQFFSPSPTKSALKSRSLTNEMEVAKGKGKEKETEKETNPESEDLFMNLTNTDDEADLAALAEVEELERLRKEFESSEGPKTRWGLVISDTKTRFNRSIPPEAETMPSRLQLMLYHRLFSSLLQPEPPPEPLPASSSTPPSVSTDHISETASPVVPSGPFQWSKLYSKLNLDPNSPLPESFLTTIEPVIEGSELEELLGDAKTLGDFVLALGKIGELLHGGTGEVLENELEISYVLRQEDGGRYKGRRSAKKKGKKKEKERSTEDETLERDGEADLEAAIRLSLQDQQIGEGGSNSSAKFDARKLEVPSEDFELILLPDDDMEQDSQLPFLANPSLPLPFDLPPPLSQQRIVIDENENDEDEVAPFSLPMNSQANRNDDDEPLPAIPIDSTRRQRYNLRSKCSNRTNETSPATATTTEEVSSQTPRKRSRSISPPPPPADTPLTAESPTSPSSPETSISAPTIIGVKRFPLSLPLLSSHLSKTLSYWNGEREPEGVSIEDVKRCRTCEFEEGCEWREGKAREMEERGKERKRQREREEETREKLRKGVTLEANAL